MAQDIPDLRGEEIRTAARQLAQSDRGRGALTWIAEGLDSSVLGLDAVNQEAVVLLLRSAWLGRPSSVRDAITEVLHSRLADDEDRETIAEGDYRYYRTPGAVDR